MKERIIGNLKSSPIIKRYEHNPIMSAEQVPFKSDWVFNCSVIKHKGKYVMVFRNDIKTEKTATSFDVDTNFGIAYSNDGIHFDIHPEPIYKLKNNHVKRVYDPRLTEIDGRIYMTLTASTEEGSRATTTVTDDFQNFEIIDMSLPCSRNTILFPEKINGKYCRFERPFWSGIDTYNILYQDWLGPHFSIWLSKSPDLKYWGENELLLKCDDVPYANIKIGAGPSPIKTSKGWLVIIHAVDYDPSRNTHSVDTKWIHRYTAGLMLLDLEDPSKVIGISKEPLLVPEVDYEIANGFRNYVIFPTAAILEDNGEVKIYYGAADTAVALATAHIDDLINMCKPL